MGNIIECFKYLINFDKNSFRKTNKFKPVINNDLNSTSNPGIPKNYDEEKEYLVLTIEDIDKIL